MINRRFVLAAIASLTLATSMDARLTRLAVEKTEPVKTDAGGEFERLSGHFYGELNPKSPHNAIITDIQFAPRNAHGMVEYSATFSMVKPVDMSKASGVLIYSVTNRGNGAAAPSAAGHVSVVSGWQGDVVARAGVQTIEVPTATNTGGASLTGPVLARFINQPSGTTTVSLATAISGLNYQRPETLDTTKATLNKRTSEDGEIVPIASTDWAFADCRNIPFPGSPDSSRICLKDGFDPAYLYELVFMARDPLVLGIGYAATRDLNSFLRYAEKDDTDTPNPVAKKIQWVVSQGNSQSGNFIRSYIHLGFNQDEAGRIVWDGANPHIAGRQLALNYRFAVGGGIANRYEPGSEAVLWWSDYPDKVRHRPTAGMLDRCRVTKTCPKIFETFGTLEFWELRMSPNLIGTDAKADIPIPAEVRRYYFPGTTHGGGRGGFSTAAPAPPNGCVLPANPNPESDTTRALMVDLIDWVTKGVAPPPSNYPRLAHGDLVKTSSAGFPAIPGVPSPDRLVNALLDYDFGPAFKYNDLSGLITKEPPAIKRVIPTLVPRVNKDGNDEVGVRSVLHQAPLGTYVGWNVTAAGFYKGSICGLNGGYIPFAKTKAERMASDDPRPSLEERYATHDGYVAAVKAAAQKAVKQRFLLPEDADRLIAQAAASDVLGRH
jgi:Alpha/beta hydrolase domain